MTISNRRTIGLLFAGDLVCLVLSLYVALVIRAGGNPDMGVGKDYIPPFAILIVVWILDFYIAGLYDKPTLMLKSRLPAVILKTQIVNAVLAALFFYFFPGFGVTPKTVLAIYLVVSFIAMFIWRWYSAKLLSSGERQAALLIGEGAEMQQLFDTVNGNKRFSIRFVSFVNPGVASPNELIAEIGRLVQLHDIRIIAVDFGNDAIDTLIPELYDHLFSNIHFVDSHDIYEDAFDRIPLSLVTHSWFLKNISADRRSLYDGLKRTMDIVISLILGILSLALFPFLYVAIKLEDGWKIFIHQERIGQNDQPIMITKYRSMSIDDTGEGKTDRAKTVTKVGKFIRASRIDELPQLWNVLKGDLSLIGPRPELPNLVRLYEEEIPFYKVRHMIKPGLSGWAQLYDLTPPKYGTDFERTRSKLSYDLYYVKNRSFLLDCHIVLKTVKDLISRRGI